MTHTPGPWEIRRMAAGGQILIVPHYDEHDRRSVADVVPVAGEPKMDALANAKLIAAAPALLEALEKLLHECEILNSANIRLAGITEARDAIQAAKGEA